MTARSLLCTVVAAAAVATATAQVWAADRGIQFTPSGDQVLVNKDVGTERWAITLNNDDGTVTGNVFRSDGGLPAFISCNPMAQPNSFACFGADPCSDGGTQRGIQRTPDGKRILVNKDVGIERWAIALNDDDETVTGNVFRQGGGDPAFIVCDPLPAENSFACSGADNCNVEPCADDFTFIDNVTLPSSFFEVPQPCAEPFNFIANVTLPDDFFRLTMAEDFISEVETSTGTPGTLRVGAAPIPGPGAPSPVSGVAGSTNASPGGTNDVTVNLGGGGASADSATVTASENIAVSSFLIIAIADETCTASNFVSNFYEIPLPAGIGQVSLSVTFSESLGGNDFVLCITVVEGGVVGQYFVFEQTAGACGNSQLDGSEVCDPPAAQSQCPTGELCSNNCLQCVPATSCAGRCCPGRDDNCTAEGAPCFCDEFCVTANDCCEDALGECGFGPAAPTISSLTQGLEALNSCSVGAGPAGSLFIAGFSYTDPDGDVTTNATVEFTFQFLPSGNSSSGNTPANPNGTGSAGSVQLAPCYRFGDDTSMRLTLTLRDNAGNPSNTLSVTTSKPQGAN